MQRSVAKPTGEAPTRAGASASARATGAASRRLKEARRATEARLVYTPTTFTDASRRAQALSQDVASLIRRRRSEDPSLGVPDALLALELAKASLLEESGIGLTGRRLLLAVAVALSVAVTGFSVFFLMNS